MGVTSDIESAFLQIGIDPADREKLRFLWYDNVNSEQPKLVQFRFCRLMIRLKPSPPILGKVVQHHLNSYEEKEPETVNQLSKLYAGPAEPVRPLRPWSDQKSCHLWSEPCNFSVQDGPIIVRLRFFSNGRTNLDLLPPLLVC